MSFYLQRVDDEDGTIYYEAHEASDEANDSASFVQFYGFNAKSDCEKFIAMMNTPAALQSPAQPVEQDDHGILARRRQSVKENADAANKQGLDSPDPAKQPVDRSKEFETILHALRVACVRAESTATVEQTYVPAIKALEAISHASQPVVVPVFQKRVDAWMLACFGIEIAADKTERNHRFIEEALELVQACGATASECHQLVDYVFGRPIGEPFQELGGVMVTLAALASANDMSIISNGEIELTRIWTKVEQIRAKQAAKPKHSPLPVDVKQPVDRSDVVERNVPDFGDYVYIEQKRHGVENEHYVHKVVGALKSNAYVPVPVQFPPTLILGDEVVDVIQCICCGIDETKVKQYRVSDVRKKIAAMQPCAVIGEDEAVTRQRHFEHCLINLESTNYELGYGDAKHSTVSSEILKERDKFRRYVNEAFSALLTAMNGRK